MILGINNKVRANNSFSYVFNPVHTSPDGDLPSFLNEAYFNIEKLLNETTKTINKFYHIKHY
jgi:hypothetical protein